MDWYGYDMVSNNYYGQPMYPWQGRMMPSAGRYPHYRRPHMPPTQPIFPYQKPDRMAPAPVIMNQPRRGRGVSEFDQPLSPPGRKWTTGKSECFQHCPSCMAAFFCQPFFACYLTQRMSENPFGSLSGIIFMTALRYKLRTVNGIEGSLCEDMCANLFCSCCVMAQMYREIQNTTE